MIVRILLAAFTILLCAASPQQRALLLSGKPGPSLSCDFITTPTVTAGTIAAGPKCPPITFSRADCNPTGACATYFDAAGVMQTAATNVARFDYDPVTLVSRGLLIEEARQNILRNSTMVGAVAGTPGTLPTNWVFSGTAVTRQLVSISTVNGMSGITLRFSGTPNTTAAQQLFTDDGTITISAGSAYTSTFYVSLVAGTPPQFTLRLDQEAGGTVFTPSSSLTRYENTRTATGTVGRSTLRWAYADTVTPVDFTIFVAMPQLELGAFATSAIPTTTAAATRAADVASMPTGPWFNAAQGTLAVEYQVPQASIPALNPGPIEIDDGTTANLIGVRQNTPNTTLISGYIANASQGGMTFATSWAANTPSRVGFTYNGTAITTSINGAATTGGSFSALPTGLTRVSFGTVRGGTINGAISRVRYWPRAQAGGELQGNTR